MGKNIFLGYWGFLFINSLAPGKFEWNFRHVIFKLILVIAGWGICCEIVLILMSLDFTDDQSALVQVMAWCHQATIHYLSQCWPQFLSPSGITRPSWVKGDNNCASIFSLTFLHKALMALLRALMSMHLWFKLYSIYHKKMYRCFNIAYILHTRMNLSII